MAFRRLAGAQLVRLDGFQADQRRSRLFPALHRSSILLNDLPAFHQQNCIVIAMRTPG
jgi:hypothetical protein